MVALTQKYHRLLWGQHGKGARSKYSAASFGDFYVQLQRIKGGVDGRNQLNPGRIATPYSEPVKRWDPSLIAKDVGLLKIDEVPTRVIMIVTSPAVQGMNSPRPCIVSAMAPVITMILMMPFAPLAK